MEVVITYDNSGNPTVRINGTVESNHYSSVDLNN